MGNAGETGLKLQSGQRPEGKHMKSLRRGERRVRKNGRITINWGNRNRNGFWEENTTYPLGTATERASGSGSKKNNKEETE